MAHIHGAAGAAKVAAEHAMMGHATMNSGAGHVGTMMTAVKHALPVGEHTALLTKGAIATGAVATAAVHTRGSFMSLLAKHPLIVFSLGVTAGYFVHKYRKEIIATASRVTEQGKDFVLQQKENLEDLVSECKECQENQGKEKAG
jgi:hypothetical protein